MVIFVIFASKTYLIGGHWSYLSEAISVTTHKISCSAEISYPEMLPQLSLSLKKKMYDYPGPNLGPTSREK